MNPVGSYVIEKKIQILIGVSYKVPSKTAGHIVPLVDCTIHQRGNVFHLETELSRVVRLQLPTSMQVSPLQVPVKRRWHRGRHGNPNNRANQKNTKSS